MTWDLEDIVAFGKQTKVSLFRQIIIIIIIIIISLLHQNGSTEIYIYSKYINTIHEIRNKPI